MAFKKKLIDGVLSYVYYKIAQEGKYTIRLPEDFLQHVLSPFLSYYMTQVSVNVHEGGVIIKGSSLVTVSLELETPIVRDEEIVIPIKMNKLLGTFISTFAGERIKPLRIEQNKLIIPTKLIYNALEEVPEDLKIQRINIKEGEIEIEIVSRK